MAVTGEITIQNNKQEILNRLPDVVEAALEAIGLTAEGYAKELCPVDTGRLRNSISHAVEGDAVYIGTNVEYAPYVELGTSKMRARPFLGPAAENHGQEYKELFEAAMKNG